MKLLFVDSNTHLNTLDDLKTSARGGMVSSLLIVTDGLARKGYDVHVWGNDFDAVSDDGVKWHKDPEVTDADAIIFNRGIGDGAPALGPGKRFLWTHDLPHAGHCKNHKYMNMLTCMVSMSKYGDRVWRDMFDYTGKSVLIPNGVDKELFKPGEKDPSYLIYASAPNRGLWRLPLIFDAIRTHVPGTHMRAYSDMKTLHPAEAKETEANYELDYHSCEEAGIERLDPIPQHELAVEIGRAGLMILPTNYPEICSNSILQSLACGTPVITAGSIGSAPEWLKHKKNSMLTTYQARDYMVFQRQIIQNTVTVLRDKRMHLKMMRAAVNTKILSWADVIEKWDAMVRRYC